ncbi:glycoside hydrolase family 2 [Spartobacteria bacterium LR76]|nr:glycoside hydrolase family 2 [Spartobacteria bacterium LR76]
MSRPFIPLDGFWQWTFTKSESVQVSDFGELRKAGLPIYPCTVPGCLESDMESNGLLKDLFVGRNILEIQHLENLHVFYAREFAADEWSEEMEPWLVFEGVDCFADVYLNGTKLGSCDNMLIAHEFFIGSVLQARNELLVHIRPTVEEAKKVTYPLGPWAPERTYESLPVRKAPHMYGWDIMPRAVSAGLWRPARVDFRPVERLETCHLDTAILEPDDSLAELTLSYEAHLQPKSDADYEITVEGRCGASVFSGSQKMLSPVGRLRVKLSLPQLWWPRGSGDSRLYEVEVRLLKDGTQVDARRFRHGIRKIELVRTSVTDENGSGEFVFLVNGEKVFIKGTNWVPVDAFHWRDRLRLPQIVPMLEDLHCNMIRCWGGNVYEDDYLFDWCDEHGIMVWQDFAMACALYPQDESFQAKLAEEVRHVARRLRHHACLVLWAGDNECDEAHFWLQAGDPNRNALTRRLIPAVLREEDPGRPYLPSSPYIDETAFHQGGTQFSPENHLWGPRGYFKDDFYTKAACHFASEIGYHGCPSVESLRRFLSPDKIWPPQNNDEWILHSTNPRLDTSLFSPPDFRVNLMFNQVKALFGQVPEALEDFVFASQATQAEALKFFIERFRSAKWRRTGILWWNLMDGWPQFSDAVVDYYFNRKLAYEFIRRSQKDVCVMLREPESDSQQIVAVNDLRHEAFIRFVIRDFAAEREISSGEHVLSANSAQVVGSLPYDPHRQTLYRIEWTSRKATDLNHYLAGHPPFDLSHYRRWLTEAIAGQIEQD